jgi:hypothetical protein
VPTNINKMNQTTTSNIQLAKDDALKAVQYSDILAIQAAQEAQIASCAACEISRTADDQLEKAKDIKILKYHWKKT